MSPWLHLADQGDVGMLTLRILDPRAYVFAAAEAVMFMVRNFALLMAMTKRELIDRYVGQVLGAAWAVLTPLFLMTVYVFVFTFIFHGRMGTGGGSNTAYVAFMLSGLAPWLGLQEGFSRSAVAIVSNGNLVKQIVFPSEVLPMRVALATVPALLIGLAIAVSIGVASGYSNMGALLLIPFCVVFYVIFLAGCCYTLAALGVFVRDLKDVITLVLSVGLFLLPILYPPGGGPPWLEAYFPFNPISHLIWCFQDAIKGVPDNAHWSWYIFPISSVIIFTLGWRIFRMLKPTFGNAL